MHKLLLVVATVFGMQMTASVAQASCKAEAAATLDQMGIENTLVGTDKVKMGGKSNLIKGYIHWFRTPLCEKGYVVVRTARSCKVSSVYTQTGCQIEGLDRWW